MALDAPQSMAPVQPGERIQIIDMLRGFALLGILLVNMQLFAHPVQTLVLPADAPLPVVDQVAGWLVRFAAEGKFYSLFSLLFGLGLTIQMVRAEERGAPFIPLYVRRLLILLAIGLVHAFLIWVGDILIVYALLGFVLLLFRNAGARTLVIWAVLFLALLILLVLLGTIALELGRAVPEAAAQIEQSFAMQEAVFRADAERAYQVYAAGSFIEITQQRIHDYFTFMSFGIVGMTPGVLAMFVVGVYFGRRQLFRNVEENVPLFRNLLWWGLIIGVIGNGIYATLIGPATDRIEPTWTLFVATAAQTMGAPALMLCYLSGLTLLSRREVWANRLQVLAPVGRMALTNYLGQSIICTLIFYGYGLGFFGQMGTALGLVLTFVIYALQIAISNWWMARFRFGPAEWLWRTLTYGRLQPIRTLAPSHVG